jgi:hypothetical protein
MANTGKYDEVLNSIRWLAGRNPSGVPLDVADDVARAAMRDMPVRGEGFVMDPPPNYSSADRFRDEQTAIAERAIRGTTTSPDALYDSAGRSLPEGVRGWPAGTESWAAPPTRFDGIEVGPLDSAPDFELGSPLWNQLHKSSNSYENLLRNRTPNLRNQNPQLSRIAGQELRDRASAATASRAADAQRAQGMREGLGELGAAAATVGIGAGLSSMYPSGESPAPGDMTDTSGTEDLAAESRPAPSVEPDMPPEEQEFADRFKRQYLAREAKRNAPVDYSFQARELMSKLNAMRKAAGGEVPEAKQMMAEIDRLLEMSNQQKNAPGYKPAMPTDYHGEAQRLLQDLNARRMEAGGEVADTQKVMAEVRRLQAMGDQMRNAR